RAVIAPAEDRPVPFKSKAVVVACRNRYDIAQARWGGDMGTFTSPSDDGPIPLQRHIMNVISSTSNGYPYNICEIRRHLHQLPRETAPRNHGPVLFEGKRIKFSGSNRNHVAQLLWDPVLTPSHKGAIALKC